MKNKILLSLSCVGLLASCGPTIGNSTTAESTNVPPASSSSEPEPSSSSASASSVPEQVQEAKRVLEGNYLRTKIHAQSLDFNLGMQAVGQNKNDQSLYLADDHMSFNLDNFNLDTTVNNERDDYKKGEMAIKSSGVFGESHVLDVPEFDLSAIFDLLGGEDIEEEPIDLEEDPIVVEPGEEGEAEEEQKNYTHIADTLASTAYSMEAYMKDGVAYLNLKNNGFWSIYDYFVGIIEDWSGSSTISTAFSLAALLLKMNPAYVDLKELLPEEEEDPTSLDEIIDFVPAINYDSLYDYLDESTAMEKKDDGYHYTIELEKADIIDFLSEMLGGSDMMDDIMAQLNTNLKLKKCAVDLLVTEGLLDIDFDIDIEAKLPGTFNPLITDYELKQGEQIKPMEFSFVAKGDVQFTSPESITWPANIGEDYGNDLTETISAAIDLIKGDF